MPKGISAVFLVFALSLPAQAAEELFINTAVGTPLSTKAGDGLMDKVMKEAFKRLGISVEIAHPPPERSLRQANAGVDDGDGPRIGGLEKNYPNLIPVPEALMDMHFVAVTQGDLTFESSSWDTLKPYNVGVITGWKIYEKNITGAKSLVKVKNPEALFKGLKNGDFEVAATSKYMGTYLGKKAGIEKVNILQPPLAVKPMFLYLHKKHADLIPKLTQVIREMKKDGSYQKIMDSEPMPE